MSVTATGRAHVLSDDRRLAVAVFFLSLAVYLLTYDGSPISNDERALISGIDSWLKRGVFTTNQIYWDYTHVGVLTTSGDMVPNYEPAQMVLAVPFYLLGRTMGAAVQGSMLFGAVITAAAVALLYLSLLELGYSRRTAALGAGVFAFATAAWPYSRTFYREPLTVLAYLGAFYALLRYRPPAPRGVLWPAIAGTALGIALTTKQISIAVIPSMLLLVLAAEWRRPDPAGQAHWLKSARLRATLAALAPLALILLLGRLYHAVTLGGVELFARDIADYATNPQLSTSEPASLLYAALGLTISPYKGLFWFSPVALLGLAGALPTLRRHRWEGLAYLGVFAAHLLGYSRYLYWSGGVTWGSRYMMQTLSFLILLAAPVLAWALRDRSPAPASAAGSVGDAKSGGRLARIGIAGLILLSLAVQVLGVSIDVRTYEVPWLLENAQVWGGIGEAIQGLYMAPMHSPVLGHLRLLLAGAQPLDFAWVQLRQEGRWALLPAGLVLGLVTVGLSALAGVWIWRRPRRAALAGTGLTALFCVVSVLLLGLYRQGDARFDPYGVDRFLAPMRASLDAPAPAGPAPCRRPGPLAPADCRDVLVVPDEVLTDYFLNYLGPELPWYAVSPRPLDTRLLDLLLTRYDTVWLARDRNAGADDAEDRRAAERYLTEHAYKVDEQRYGDWARLLRFASPGRPAESYAPGQALSDMTLVTATLSLRPSPPPNGADPLDDRVVHALAGDTLDISLQWRADAPPAANYTVFLQLLNSTGQVAAQRDRWPGDGLYPTAVLRAGEVITDNLALPLGVPPGKYSLIAGLYRNDLPGSPRLSGPGGDFVTLGTIDVQAQP